MNARFGLVFGSTNGTSSSSSSGVSSSGSGGGSASLAGAGAGGSRHHSRLVVLPDLHGDGLQALRALQLAGLASPANAANAAANVSEAAAAAATGRGGGSAAAAGGSSGATAAAGSWQPGSWRWSGGDALLVQLGDVVDRGPDSLALLALMERLRVQARSAGGDVVMLLGNHELMNIFHDFRYVSPLELTALATAGGLPPEWDVATDTSAAASAADGRRLAAGAAAIAGDGDHDGDHDAAAAAAAARAPDGDSGGGGNGDGDGGGEEALGGATEGAEEELSLIAETEAAIVRRRSDSATAADRELLASDDEDDADRVAAAVAAAAAETGVIAGAASAAVAVNGGSSVAARRPRDLGAAAAADDDDDSDAGAALSVLDRRRRRQLQQHHRPHHHHQHQHLVSGLDIWRGALAPEAPLGRLIRQRSLAAIADAGGCRILAVHAGAFPWMVQVVDRLLTPPSPGPRAALSPEAAAAAAAAVDGREGDAGEEVGGSRRRLRAEQYVEAWNAAVEASLRGCEGRACRWRVGGAVGGEYDQYDRARAALADMLLGGEGAVWSRRHAHSSSLREVCGEVAAVAERLGVERLVVGHTVQRGGRVSSRCGGELLLADVGLSRAIAGEMAVLTCSAGKMEVLYGDGRVERLR